ncbi:MAG: hypothetical protein R2838_23655 [Caldilineaceae bacterium]
MVLDAEDIKLLLLLVPVTADAAEAAGAVVEGVVEQADGGLFNGDDVAVDVTPWS